MQRREFLQTLGAAAPAAIATQTAAGAAPADCESSAGEPRVFIYDDGRHASGLYQFAPPLSPEAFTSTVDQLVDSGVDTLLYSAGLEGGVVQYDSRVAQKWGDNVDIWSHEIFYRAARNLRQLIGDGHDPMKLMCDRCHEKGIRFLPTCPVCILGGQRGRDLGYGRKSDFVLDNPQYYVGAGDTDRRVKLLGRFFQPTRLNFMHAEVRQERFAIFEELLSRYETDGIELDLSIDNEFGPFCKFNEIERLAPLLTEWIGRLRAAARRAEKAQGRRKRIYVRIPAQPASSWKMIGLEVDAWVSQELVDGLICMTASKKETPTDQIVLLDQDLDLSAAVELTRQTPCRVLAGLHPYLGRQLETSATPPMIWAAAALAYDRGVDGFGLCEGAWSPNGWPWTDAEYQTLRLLGHPDLLATADKLYRARSLASGSGSPKGLFPLGGPLLPLTLAKGQPLDVPLRMVDDLDHWHVLGRVGEIRLRVRLTNFEMGLNEIEVQLNDQPLPDALLRPVDLHFRMLKRGAVGPYGYVLEYFLPPEYFPRQGKNVVTVTLRKRDPKLNLPVDVYDVDCAVTYRRHRHFERQPIDY